MSILGDRPWAYSPPSRTDSNDGYDRMVARLYDSYHRAPWDWEDIEPGPDDIWYGRLCPPGQPGYIQHKISGVILVRPPSEGAPMTNAMQSMTGIGTTGIQPPNLAPLSFKEAYRSDVRLGQRYRDEQTGFEGTATSIAFYQHACERVSLENYNKKRGLEEITFDAKRLVHLPSGQAVDSDIPGGPDRGNLKRPTPKR